jgi:molybdopterin synthase catalytic subunit
MESSVLQEIKTEWGYFAIQSKPIDVHQLMKMVQAPEMGAINTFIGTVREWTKGKRTVSLEYEAYISMAVKKLAVIGEEIRERWPESKVAISHRIGRLDIGEMAVVIVVGTPHRDAAFHGSRHAIERIKEMVPIWKKEIWEDGDVWVGDQLEKHPSPEGGVKVHE